MPPKKKKVNIEKKEELEEPEGEKAPSEKNLLQRQVDDLQAELQSLDDELVAAERILDDARRAHSEAVQSKRACAEHLIRVLESDAEAAAGVQGRFQRARDLTQLMEKRAEDMERNVQKSVKLQEGKFIQEKTDLEDQLSRLEEVRMKREKALGRLARAESALADRVWLDRRSSRERDRTRVGELLRRREAFEELLDDVTPHFRAVFKLAMPVRAKKVVEENVRLRKTREVAAREYLKSSSLKKRTRTSQRKDKKLGDKQKVQDKTKEHKKENLTDEKKGTKREAEIGNEVNLKVELEEKEKFQKDKRYKKNEEDQKKELSKNKEDEEKKYLEENVENQRSEEFRGIAKEIMRNKDDVKQKDLKETEEDQTREELEKIENGEMQDVFIVAQKCGGSELNEDEKENKDKKQKELIENKRDLEGDISVSIQLSQQEMTNDKKNSNALETDDSLSKEFDRLTTMKDALTDMKEVSADQDQYMDSLERELGNRSVANDMLMSKILRAVMLIKARINEENLVGVNKEFLLQIRMLLEDDV